MTLEFLGDAGIYLPQQDGIKFSAVIDGTVREYVVTRAALIAAGAAPTMDPTSLLGFFEQNRGMFEATAAGVAASSELWHLVHAEDIERARLGLLGVSAASSTHPRRGREG
jgi:hypothetical protein